MPSAPPGGLLRELKARRQTQLGLHVDSDSANPARTISRALWSRAALKILLWRGYDMKDEVERGEQVDEFFECEFLAVGLQ